MHVPDGAKLLLNAREVKLADLSPDDRVRISHLKDLQGRAARDVIRLDALRTMTLTGSLEGVASEKDTVSILVVHLRTTTKIEIASDCRCVRTSSGSGFQIHYPYTCAKPPSTNSSVPVM